jgi:hypothetical protein
VVARGRREQLPGLHPAIHAIEDSFTHTYRTPDGMEISVALNYIDEVKGTLVESRDGPAHATALDRCDDPDTLSKLLARVHMLGIARRIEVASAVRCDQSRSARTCRVR